MTPIRFLTSRRIKRAEELLEERYYRIDTTVSIIAMLVGFNDVGIFIKQFKKVNGVTPAVYGKSSKKKFKINGPQIAECRFQEGSESNFFKK